jgi:hypothetical protein
MAAQFARVSACAVLRDRATSSVHRNADESLGNRDQLASAPGWQCGLRLHATDGIDK